MKFPSGVLVHFDDKFYRVSDSKLHEIISWNAVMSWGQAILVSDFIFDYEVSEAKIGFRPTSLLKGMDNRFYFIEGNKRRIVSTPEFWELGFNEFEAILVSDEELNFHKEGEPIV